MMYGICAIWKTPVEVRRNGVGAFLVQLFGHKKSLQGWKSTPCRLFRAERENWLLRSRWSLRLTPFPSARRRGPCKPTAQKAASPHLLFPHLCLQVNLRQRYKNKRYRFLDTFLLRGLAEREGFEPPEPRSSTVFKTAAIDHSATSPKDKGNTTFVIHQIFLELFLNIFCGHFIWCCISAIYTQKYF